MARETSAISLERIEYEDPRAAAIRELMDEEMFALYAGVGDSYDADMQGKIQAALAIHPEAMIATVGAFDGERLVGHAALRPVSIEGVDDSLEVKRVIVLPEYRGRGISKRLMAELEVIARERGIRNLVLQTGDRQAEAIALYRSIGYGPIERFGLYAPVPFFLCYGKLLPAR